MVTFLHWGSWAPRHGAAGQRAAIALTLGVLLAGCASDPGAVERARFVQALLEENTESVSITQVTEPPAEPVLAERESTWLEAAAQWGLAGALAPWVGMASSENFDLEVALFLTPVFAVGSAIYGAIEAEPRETSISFDQAPGVEPLLSKTLQDRRFETALLARVASIGNRETGRRWRVVEPARAEEPGQGPTPSGAVVMIALERLGFLRDKGEDEFVLAVEGNTYIADAIRLQRVFWRRWAHESAEHPLAEWVAGDRALFDRTLEESTVRVAREIVDSLIEVARDQGSDD